MSQLGQKDWLGQLRTQIADSAEFKALAAELYAGVRDSLRADGLPSFSSLQVGEQEVLVGRARSALADTDVFGRCRDAAWRALDAALDAEAESLLSRRQGTLGGPRGPGPTMHGAGAGGAGGAGVVWPSASASAEAAMMSFMVKMMQGEAGNLCASAGRGEAVEHNGCGYADMVSEKTYNNTSMREPESVEGARRRAGCGPDSRRRAARTKRAPAHAAGARKRKADEDNERWRTFNEEMWVARLFRGPRASDNAHLLFESPLSKGSTGHIRADKIAAPPSTSEGPLSAVLQRALRFKQRRGSS